jgi:uncharacterized protein (DUF2267 family)
MTDEAFLQAVQRAGDLEDVAAARRAAESVLATLAGSLTWGEAQNLASALPPRLARLVRSRSFQSSMGRFSRSAFLRAVQEEARTSPDQAARYVAVVLAVLDGLLPAAHREELRAELPWLSRR